MTGHKSVQSLTIYQCLKNKTKIQMGKVLQKSLVTHDDTLLKLIEMTTTPKTQKEITPPMPKKAIEAPTASASRNDTSLVPFEPNFDDDDLDDIDWLKVLCDVENPTVAQVQDKQVSNTIMQQRNSTMFANC